METLWYVKRADREFGPCPESQMRSYLQVGKLLPNDLVRQQAETAWRTAAECLVSPDDIPLAEAVDETPLQLNCLACFSDWVALVVPGISSVSCPACGTTVDVAADGSAPTSEQAFANLEDPAERVRRRVQEAYAREAEENGVLDMIARDGVKGILKEVAKEMLR